MFRRGRVLCWRRAAWLRAALPPGPALAYPSLSPVGRNRWSNPARLRFNQAKLGKQEPAAPSGEPATWGLAQGQQDKGHQGPGLWPSPQCGTGAPTDSVSEGSAGSTWHWGWPGSREQAVPCLVPAAALPALPVLGSTGAAAAQGKGCAGSGGALLPSGTQPHAICWAAHHGAHPGTEHAGALPASPVPWGGSGAPPGSSAAKAGMGPP